MGLGQIPTFWNLAVRVANLEIVWNDQGGNPSAFFHRGRDRLSYVRCNRCGPSISLDVVADRAGHRFDIGRRRMKSATASRFTWQDDGTIASR